MLLRALLSSRKGAVGVALVGMIVLAALLAPVLVRFDPLSLTGDPHEAPSATHVFGTTGQGQDVLAQTFFGARTSLAIGFATGAIVVGLGALVGVSAALYGGWIDELLSLGTNVFLVLPGLPLAIVIAAYLPPGPMSIAIVLVVTGWAWNARVLRSQALAIRQRDFVAAAIVSGEGRLRIVTHEILPNMAQLLASSFVSATLAAIGAEVGLEFVGVGDVSRVTWGTNLYWAANDAALLTGSWWTIVPTGLSIALVGFGLALLSSAIDEAFDPRLRAQGGAAAMTPVVRPRAPTERVP
jgi:peptide/nickel transport system permease protein